MPANHFKRFLFFALLTIVPNILFSQANIKITIDNEVDSLYYLLRYKGEKTFAVDTSRVNKNSVVFKKKDNYPEGIYMLVNSKKQNVMDLLLAADQKFSVRIKDLDDMNSLKVKGSGQTKRFFKLMNQANYISMYIKALDSEKSYFPENFHKIDSLETELKNFSKSLAMKDSTAFINSFIKAMEMPKSGRAKDYWNGFPFYDERIINTPLIDKRLNAYFDNCVCNHPDSINVAVDKLLLQTIENETVKDYVLWRLYAKYYSPDYMHLDEVYIHLVDNYFLSSSIAESVKSMMKERSDALKHLLLGLPAPSFDSLYNIDSQFTVLFFYNPECQQCQKSSRLLSQISEKHPNIYIYAVIPNNELDILYDIQTTPLIYLLDNEKNIIAKRITAEQLDYFLKTNKIGIGNVEQ